MPATPTLYSPTGEIDRHVAAVQAELTAFLASTEAIAALAVCHFELDGLHQLEARHVARVEQELWRANEILSSWSTTHPGATAAGGVR